MKIIRRKKRSSKGENQVIRILERYNINYEREKTFQGCRGKSNLLRFDFYLPEYRILIEFQGQHHYFPVNKYKRAEKVHNRTKYYDEIKFNFAQIHNFKLITIPYWDMKYVEYILINDLNLINFDYDEFNPLYYERFI